MRLRGLRVSLYHLSARPFVPDNPGSESLDKGERMWRVVVKAKDGTLYGIPDNDWALMAADSIEILHKGPDHRPGIRKGAEPIESKQELKTCIENRYQSGSFRPRSAKRLIEALTTRRVDDWMWVELGLLESTVLGEIGGAEDERGHPAWAYRAHVYEDDKRHAEAVEIVHLPYSQHVGIAWGGEVQWADIEADENLGDVLNEWANGSQKWWARATDDEPGGPS